MTGILAGRAAVITGGNRGLGLQIGRAYVAAGANVLLCARDGEKLEWARDSLRVVAANGQIVESLVADVSIESSVRSVAERALDLFPQVHILVNNAGVYGPIGTIEQIEWREWMRAVEINLYGSILMCRAVLPSMRAHRYGKIVQLSGGGATNPSPRMSAYAASKAAVVRFAESLAEETRGDRIDVNSLAPGPLNTRLLDEVLLAGPDRVGEELYDRSLKQKEEGGAPLTRGAALAVFLGAAASDGITGKLISAIWDPWETLAERETDLAGDVYTLRRIVPKDRGFGWGDR